MNARFAEAEITPPVGILKIGWKKTIVSDYMLDPLFARAAVFESDGQRIAFLQLDTLSVCWNTAAEIQRTIEAKYGFPGANLMVAAMHNHAGPAVAWLGDVLRDDAYAATMVKKVVALFGETLGNRVECNLGFANGFEFQVAFNRRVVMRDGRARAGVNQFRGPDALRFEGPIYPEVAVLAARGPHGRLLGCLVNFTCHPTHHGGESGLSAGYPGALAAILKSRG
ncbi:MAG: hypothetical protein NTW86_29975 [Candidatus Sumerlaeota bacterium]|nr:hypothetical protein [Candidatus Sumerlaeota bacterium]